MENRLIKKVLLFEHPPCRNIYLFKALDFFILFGLIDYRIYVNKLTLEEVIGNTVVEKRCDLEALQYDDIIIGVFEFKAKYYGVDQSGSVFLITEEISNDSAMDYDIFEDSPEKREKWVFKDKKGFLNGQKVINFCLTDKDLALLVNSNNELSLEIIDFLEGLLIKSITVRSPGLLEELKLCTLLWMPPEETLKEFLKNWYLNFSGNSGLFVITMPEGNILVIDPNESNPETVYAWPFSALKSYWVPSVIEDVPERTLIFVTEGNSILKMTQYGEAVTEYLPIDEVAKAVLIKQNLLYISDWSDTVKYYLTSQEKPCLLLLKGILCFGSCDDQNFIFALSNNGEVYVINDNYKPHESEKMLPDSSLTAVLVEETAKLEKINRALYEYDAYIKAINLAIKNLQFSINAQVIYARKLSYTVCLTLKCLQDEIVIEKDQGWNLFLTLKVGQEVISLSQKMRSNLCCENIFTDVFSFSVPQQPIADLHVYAKFIYTKLPDFSKYFPVIYIGEFYLDPSYFLQPALEVELSEIGFHPTLGDILKKDVDSSNVIQEVDDINTMKEFKLQVDYPEEFSSSKILKWILIHSRPLWRSSLWNHIGETKMLEIAVLGHIVSLEDCGTYVLITGKDSHSCYSVKKAIFSSLPGTKEFFLPVDVIRQLEVFERTSDLYLHENPTVEELEKLRENFRKIITSNLKA